MTSPYRWIGPRPDEDEEERKRREAQSSYSWIGPRPGTVDPRPPTFRERISTALSKGAASGREDYRRGGGVSGPRIEYSPEQQEQRQAQRVEMARTASPAGAAVSAFGRGLTTPFDNLFQSEEDRLRDEEVFAALPEPTGNLEKVGRFGAELAGGFVPYIAASMAGAPMLTALGASTRAPAIVARGARFLGQNKWRTNVLRGTVLASPVNALQAINTETSSAGAAAQLQGVEGDGVLPWIGRKVGDLGAAASKTGAGRFAFETGVDLLMGGAFEGVVSGAKAGGRAASNSALADAFRPTIKKRGPLGQEARRARDISVVESMAPTRGVEVPNVSAPEPQTVMPRRPISSALDDYAPIAYDAQPQIPQLNAPRPQAPGAEVVPPIQGRRPQLAELPVEPVRPAVDRTPIAPEVIEARPYAPPRDWETMGPQTVFKEGQRAAAELGLPTPKNVSAARGLLREIAGAPAPEPKRPPPVIVSGNEIRPDLGIREKLVEPPLEPPKPKYPQPVYKEELKSSAQAAFPENPKADPEVRNVVVRYMSESKVEGRQLPPPKAVDPERGSQMAKVYDELPSTPDDPAVKSAYRSLARETRAQYEKMKEAGYRIEFVDQDPYKSSKEMMEDVRKNRRLKVYRTAEGQQHPLLTREENDLFRAVHDFFGHAREGNQFGPLGEERAFRDHSSMFSPEARRAMATETRGQNSWVNFGPGKDLPPAQRPFAQQKAALWPEELMGDYAEMPVRAPESAPKVEPVPEAPRGEIVPHKGSSGGADLPKARGAADLGTPHRATEVDWAAREHPAFPDALRAVQDALRNGEDALTASKAAFKEVGQPFDQAVHNEAAEDVLSQIEEFHRLRKEARRKRREPVDPTPEGEWGYQELPPEKPKELPPPARAKGEPAMRTDNPVTRDGDTPEARAWLERNPTKITGWYKDVELDAEVLARLPGARGEQLGKIDPERVSKLAESMRSEGFRDGDAVAIDVHPDGRVEIYEGNHRVRAAAEAGVPVKAEVRYLGGAELNPDAWKPPFVDTPPKKGTTPPADNNPYKAKPGTTTRLLKREEYKALGEPYHDIREGGSRVHAVEGGAETVYISRMQGMSGAMEWHYKAGPSDHWTTISASNKVEAMNEARNLVDRGFKGHQRYGYQPPTPPADNTLYAVGAGQAAGLAAQASDDEDVQRAGKLLSVASAAGMVPLIAKQVAKPTVRRAFAEVIEQGAEDGFSFNVRTGEKVRDGWLVGGVAKPMIVDKVTPDVLEQAAKRFAKELADERTVLGGWRNPATGKLEIEPATAFGSGERLEAIQAGVDRGEKAVGNLKGGKYSEEVLFKHQTENPDISSLDPEFMGSGPHAGAERGRPGRPKSTHLYGMAANPEQQYEALPSVFSHAPKNQVVDLSPDGLKELTKSQPELAAEIKKARLKGLDAMETVLAKRGLIYTVDGKVFKAFDSLPIFRKSGVAPGSRDLSDVLKQQVEETAGKGQKLVLDPKRSNKKSRFLRTAKALVPGEASDDKILDRMREVFLPRVLAGLEDSELSTRMWFYSRRLVQANKEVVKRFSELRDPNKMGIYNLIRAMTSANSGPLHNEDIAMSVYARWRFGTVGPDLRYKKAGVPGNVSGGDWDRKLQRLEADIKKFVDEAGGDEKKGLKAMNKWLMEREEFPTSRSTLVGANPLPNARKYLSADVSARKTTNYYMNLMGLSDRTTTDIWAVRSFRRAAGYYKEVQDRLSGKWTVDGSPEYHEYRLFERTTEMLASELRAMGYPETITPREIQALLWFDEKRLALRGGAADGGFEDYFSAWQTYPDRPWMGKVIDAKHGDLAMRPKDPKVSNTKTTWNRNVANMDDSEALRRARWHAKEYGGTAPNKADAKDYLLNVPPGQMAMYGGGAAIGAFVDEEDRLRGAAIGLGAEIGLRALMKSKLAMKRGGKAAGELGFPEVPKVQQEAVETPLQWQTKRKAHDRNLRPLSSVQRLEKNLRAGKVGEPKTLDKEPSGILTPAMLAMDPSGAEWADEIARAAKNGDTRVTVSDEELVRQANWLDANELLKDKRVARTAPEMVALASAAVKAKNRAAEVAKAIGEIRLGDTAELAAKEAELTASLQAVDAALVRMGQGASEAGRTLRSVGRLEFLAANVDDASFWVQTARKQAGLPLGAELDPKILDGIAEALKNAPRNADGSLSKDGVRVLLKAVKKARPEPSLLRKFLELTKAGLLSLPATHVANTGSNIAKATLDQGVVRPTATLLDVLLTRASQHGQRTTTTSSRVRAGYRTGLGLARREVVGTEARNSWHSAKSLGDKLRATKQAAQHVVDGMHDDNVVKILGTRGIDWKNTKGLNNKVGGLLNAYQGAIYGGLGAQDQIFRQAAVHSSLAELAEVRALNAGLKRGSKEFDSAVQHYMSKDGVDPIDLAESLYQGELAVFTEKNKLAEWVNSANQVPVLAELQSAFAPFVLTPTNIVKQTLVDYSPLQMTKVLFGSQGAFSKSGWRFDPAVQRKVVQSFGKGAVGAGLMAAGAMLFLNDRITTGYKKEDTVGGRKMRQSGKPYSSVKVGDHGWINIARLGPVGLGILMGAELARGLEEGDKSAGLGSRVAALAGTVAVETGRNITELPMLQGTSELLKMLGGEKRAREAVLGQFAGRVVPSLVGGIARGIDPIGDRQKQGPLDYMWDRVPLKREGLEPKVSPLGDTTPGRGLATELFLPGWRVERNDRVTKALERYDVAVTDVTEDKDKETHAQFLRRRIQANQAAKAAVNETLSDRDFGRLSRAEKQEEIRKAISQARSKATKEFRSR